MFASARASALLSMCILQWVLAYSLVVPSSINVNTNINIIVNYPSIAQVLQRVGKWFRGKKKKRGVKLISLVSFNMVVLISALLG